MGNLPLCIGHRGFPTQFPENTLRSLAGALAVEADGVELDTQVTRDGVAVVFHDARLRRLTGAPGTIAKCTLAQVNGLRVRGEQVPTLAAALERIGGRGIVQVEVKRGVPLAPVVRAIRKAGGTEGVILASFSLEALRAAAELAPRIPRMLIASPSLCTRNTPISLLRIMSSVGASGISVDHRAITTRGFVETIHAHGASLWCWTVNRPAEIRRLANWGVDAILSDDPRRLRRVLTTYGHR